MPRTKTSTSTIWRRKLQKAYALADKYAAGIVEDIMLGHDGQPNRDEALFEVCRFLEKAHDQFLAETNQNRDGEYEPEEDGAYLLGVAVGRRMAGVR